MIKKGRMMYVPAIVIEALDNIKTSEKISKDSFAFEKLVQKANDDFDDNFNRKKGKGKISFFPSPFEGEF